VNGKWRTVCAYVKSASLPPPPPPTSAASERKPPVLYCSALPSSYGISPVAPGARALTVAGAHPRGLAGNASPPLATTASCFGIVEILSDVGVQQDPKDSSIVASKPDRIAAWLSLMAVAMRSPDDEDPP
jgi:hypothetical protein